MKRQWKTGRALRVAAATAAAAVIAVVAAAPGSGHRAAAGGTITIGTSQGLSTIDPDKVTTFWEIQMRPLMYSALTRYTATSGANVQGDLASSWKASADLKTYTFQLRPNLQFANGSPLTSKEVVATFQRRLHPAKGAAVPAELQNLAAVTAAGPGVVRVTLKKPSVSLPLDVATTYIDDPATLKDKPGPVGSGPYKPSDYVPDDHLTLVPNDKYFGPKARAQQIQIVNTHENTAAVTGLRGGNIDAVWQIPFSDIATLEKEGGKYTVVNTKFPSTSFLMQVDVTSPPFDDVKARQALSYAIDRKTIRDAIYRGVGVVAPTGQPVPPNNPFYAKGLPTYPYDLAKAKKLFAEAGVKAGTELTFWSYNTSNEARLSGELLQNSLKKIGIKLDIRIVDVPTWVSKLYPSGKKYPAYISPNAVPGPVPEGMAQWWVSNLVGTNWNDPQFNEAIETADTVASVAKRKALYAKAERLFAEEQPAQIILYYAIPVVERSDIKGVWIDPAGFAHFEGAYRG